MPMEGAIMDESIVITMRDNCIHDKNDASFDGEILMSLNAAMFNLEQLGVIPDASTIEITSVDDTWVGVFGTIDTRLIKQYLHLKTKQILDPATSTAITSTFKEAIDMMEWRLREKFDVKGGNE